MLQHVVAITWNDQVPANYHETITKVLHDMVKQIETVRSYHCGPDLGVSATTNADYLIVATFDDVAGWRVYDETRCTTRFAPNTSSHLLQRVQPRK